MKIDYVAKSRTQSDGNLMLSYLFSAMYICYSYWVMLQLTKDDGMWTIFFFLLTFLVFCIFKIMEPDVEVVVEEAKKFLKNTGQEVTNENINLLVGRYYEKYRKNWPAKIAHILNASQEVPNFENLKEASK